MRRRSLEALSGLAVALAWGAAGAAAGEAEAKPSAAAQNKAPTYKVQEGPFRLEIKLEGVFEAARMAEVTLRLEATTPPAIEKVVAHGHPVKKGDPVIWLDPTKVDEQIRAAERDRTATQLALRDGEAELKMLEASLALDMQAAQRAQRIAQEELDYFLKVRGPRSRENADFSLQNARFQLEYAEEELKQLEKMYQADDLTEETEEIILKRARRAVESARFSLKGAEITRERALARDFPRELDQLREAAERQELAWQQARIKLPSALEKKRLDIDKLRRDQELACEKLAKLRLDRAAMVLRAPIEGIVFYGRCVRGKWPDIARMADRLQPRSVVSTDQPLVTVVSLRPLQVRVDLAEKDFQHVRRGVKGQVVPSGLGELTLAAQVGQLSQIPIAPGLFDCQVQLTDRELDARLVPGMSCTVYLVPYEKAKAVAAPLTAVFRDAKANDYVYVVQTDGQPEMRPVVVGQRTTDKVEIVRGLKAGEVILLERPAGDDS